MGHGARLTQLTRPTATAVAVVAVAALAVIAAGCGPGDADSGARSAAAGHTADGHPAAMAAMDGHAGSMDHTELAATEPSGFSIYHAESVWTDQRGNTHTLASLRGKPRLVAMLYTSCAYACPRLMLDLKRIEGELGADRHQVGFVVVSIDPERDSPERLAEFARGSRLDSDRWTLLTGDEGDVLELAALLGVQYRETAPGEFTHSNLITVLDADGVVVHRQLGLGTDPSATLEVLDSLIH